MKTLFSTALLLVSFASFSQYYYTDILGNRQTNQQYRLIQANQLKRILANGFEANNEPTKDFLLEQQVVANGRQIVTRSATIGTGEAVFTGTYNDGKVTHTKDSSANAINEVEYKYDEKGNLVSTHATSKDFDGKFSSTETHLWQYNNEGLPVRMLKIKNGVDTTDVSFLTEDGKITEETWRKNNRTIETYYYYYNNRNQLTDIARYSRKAQRLLPDYIFEYDNENRVIQMTQAQTNSANYLIYRYLYNDQGLKTKEQVFNKHKEYLGKIEYQYQ